MNTLSAILIACLAVGAFARNWRPSNRDDLPAGGSVPQFVNNGGVGGAGGNGGAATVVLGGSQNQLPSNDDGSVQQALRRPFGSRVPRRTWRDNTNGQPANPQFVNNGGVGGQGGNGGAATVVLGGGRPQQPRPPQPQPNPQPQPQPQPQPLPLPQPNPNPNPNPQPINPQPNTPVVVPARRG